ncbi:MAG: aminotransferase class V-fold PLP-dependent enzyme [Acidobacteriota bacterium]|nr:aminotransferase class V-fold PLP-dependent enzyme [Acidobacteriota bacterium]
MVEIQNTPLVGSLDIAFQAFIEACPDFLRTRRIDELRKKEFSRLDALGHVYLDYTGAGLYSESQVRQHADFLLNHVLGNPHSTNPTSVGTTENVERCRRRILTFFNAEPDEYVVIFTANASHSLKLVGESYPFEPGDRFLLTFDNHNSVNGIREFDRAHGAETTYVPVMPPDMVVTDETVVRFLDLPCVGSHKLFAYPAQSNFSGVHHPLEWIAQAQSRGWDVLLDAAAFVPTNRLDLSLWHPDFVALSFYKMFGHPTGVGALIARRQALDKLHRPWFAGGTIEVASVQADRYYMAAGAAAFEDGTLDYSNIPAVEDGLDFIDSVGMDVIHDRVQLLAGWMIEQLLELEYPNGSPLIRLYGPRSTERRGATLALNFCDRDGAIIDQEVVERLASERRISLRTGCFCNPGAGEVALGLSASEITSCFSAAPERMSYEDFRNCIRGGSGAVRVSVGLPSTFADVYAFVDFAKSFLGMRA